MPKRKKINNENRIAKTKRNSVIICRSLSLSCSPCRVSISFEGRQKRCVFSLCVFWVAFCLWSIQTHLKNCTFSSDRIGSNHFFMTFCANICWIKYRKSAKCKLYKREEVKKNALRNAEDHSWNGNRKPMHLITTKCVLSHGRVQLKIFQNLN